MNDGDHVERVREAWRSVCVTAMWVMFVLCLAIWARACTAQAHDYKRPDLDAWYGSLTRPGMGHSPFGITSCCSKQDCHTTEAFLKDGAWWAKVGKRRSDGDWDLVGNAVRIPTETVLKNHDNPTGEGVICHSVMTQFVNGHDASPEDVTVWCFIPPTET